MWILKYSLDDNLLSCKLFIMWHCDSVGPSLYVLCCRLRAFQLIAPIDVGGRQDSYRSPPQRSTTPSSVFQYDNKTDLEVNNTGYLMTLMMLGEDRIQDIVRTQCHNVTMFSQVTTLHLPGTLGAAAFGVLALTSTTRRKRSSESHQVVGRREQEVLFITNFRYFTGNYGGSGDNPAVNTAPCQELIPDLGPPFLASLGV